MSDAETKTETKVSGTPEKKVVEGKKEKEVVEKKVEEAEEETKPSDNGSHENESNGTRNKQNGLSEKKGGGPSKEEDDDDEEEEEEEKDSESTTNGDSTDAPLNNAACSIKRKSTGGEGPEDAATEVASPKKAKLDDKSVAEVESNGKAAEVKA